MSGADMQNNGGSLLFELHPRQMTAMFTLATEVLYGGAAGGGKSHLMRVALAGYCAAVDGLQAFLFRRSRPELWAKHMTGPAGFPAMLAEWTRKGLADINHSKGIIDFANGSRIHLCHCLHKKNVWNYQGAEIHFLCIDELTQWEEDMYCFLRGRVRLGGLNVPDKLKGFFPRILAGANPGGIGHGWVKQNWIDFAQAMDVAKAPQQEGGMDRQFIPARLQDNPTLTENDPHYRDRLMGLGNPELVKAMLDGDWDIVAGGAVDDVWDRDAHVIKPFTVPASWRVDRSMDWGSSKPFSVGWWAVSDGTGVRLADGTVREFPRGTIFRIAEYYGWNGRPDQGCRMLAADVAREIVRIETMVLRRAVAPGPADSSIFDANNGVSIGDEMARAGVHWERADKSPGSRKAGLETLRSRLAAGLKTPMEEPGFFVFETCRQFIRTVPVLPRDRNDPDDVDTKAEDHIYDETRYRLSSRNNQPTLSIKVW